MTIHPCIRVMAGIIDEAIPEAMRAADRIAAAREVIDAELEASALDAARYGAPRTPVIPPGQMWDLADRWRLSPELRALIREAARRTEAEVAVSRVVRGLWEMSRSDLWLEPVR